MQTNPYFPHARFPNFLVGWLVGALSWNFQRFLTTRLFHFLTFPDYRAFPNVLAFLELPPLWGFLTFPDFNMFPSIKTFLKFATCPTFTFPAFHPFLEFPAFPGFSSISPLCWMSRFSNLPGFQDPPGSPRFPGLVKRVGLATSPGSSTRALARRQPFASGAGIASTCCGGAAHKPVIARAIFLKLFSCRLLPCNGCCLQ